MTRIPPALALRLTGQDSLTVVMAVIEEQSARIEVLGAENRALQAEKGAQAAEIRTQSARIETLEAENQSLQAWRRRRDDRPRPRRTQVCRRRGRRSRTARPGRSRSRSGESILGHVAV